MMFAFTTQWLNPSIRLAALLLATIVCGLVGSGVALRADAVKRRRLARRGSRSEWRGGQWRNGHCSSMRERTPARRPRQTTRALI